MQNFQKFLYHYGNYFFKKDFKHLILHVTNHCNFRCAHCFVDFTNPPKDLKTDHYEKISKSNNLLSPASPYTITLQPYICKQILATSDLLLAEIGLLLN